MIYVFMPVANGSIDKWYLLNERYKILYLNETHSQHLSAVKLGTNADLNHDSSCSRFFSVFSSTHNLCSADVIKEFNIGYTHNFGLPQLSLTDHYGFSKE